MKDITIIGAGPGGYVAAIRAAQLGLEVAVVEKEFVGGTCLNVGCIPTKTYVSMADLYAKMKESDHMGIYVKGEIAYDMNRMIERKNEVVSKLVSGIEYIFKKRNIELYRGLGEIVGPGKVKVGDEIIETKNIVIATGSRPNVPGFMNIPGFTYTSRELLDIEKKPASITVIGGGVIGVEFASIWSNLDVQVNIIEMEKNLLPDIDKRLTSRLKSLLKKRGVKIYTSRKAEKVEAGKVTLDDGTEVESDILLVAIGRKPVFDGIDTETLGIEMTKRGHIKVNEKFETSVEGIYAIGDILDTPQLAHVASKEGIAAVENIAGLNGYVNYDAVPWAVFTSPEIAVVGKQEGDVPNAKTGKFPFSANGKALGAGETEGYVKIIADESGIVVGMEAMGPHASDLIHEGALAVHNKMDLHQVADAIHAHPTLSEAVAEAAENALDMAIHII